MPCQMNSQKRKRERARGRHGANRCYWPLPVPVCRQHQNLLQCDGLAGTMDQGAGGLHLLARVCLHCPLLLGSVDSSSEKHFFEKREKGLNTSPEFKAPVKVHTLTILPNHHFFVYCFPLIFSLLSFLQNGTLQFPKTELLPAPWLPPFPPSADHTGSECPGEASLTRGRVSFQLLWKNERTQFIRVPACRENKFRKSQSPDQSCSIS